FTRRFFMPTYCCFDCNSFRLASFFLLRRRPSRSTLFPYTTLFRSVFIRISSYQLKFLLFFAYSYSYLFLPTLLLILLLSALILRSEEHTSELQSRFDLVCRLLLEKKKHHMLPYLLE